MKCWASGVSECGGVQSREHYISRGLFTGKMIRVSGLPFLKGETKEISIDSLTRKCLCEKHNNSLSPFDGEAISFAQALVYARELVEKRKGAKPGTHFSVHHKNVDVEKFCRWILKTYINILEFTDLPSRVSKEVLAGWVYSSDKVSGNVCLEFALDEGDGFEIFEAIDTEFICGPEGIIGMQFSLYGVSIRAVFGKDDNQKKRFKKILFQQERNRTSCVIEFR